MQYVVLARSDNDVKPSAFTGNISQPVYACMFVCCCVAVCVGVCVCVWIDSDHDLGRGIAVKSSKADGTPVIVDPR